MGQIIIEIPQNVRRNYRIVTEEAAQKLIENLDRVTEKQKKEEDEDLLGLWTKSEPFVKKKTV